MDQNEVVEVGKVQMNWKCRWTIFSTIMLEVWSVHKCTLVNGMFKIGFHLSLLMIGLAWWLLENKPPSQLKGLDDATSLPCSTIPITFLVWHWSQYIYLCIAFAPWPKPYIHSMNFMSANMCHSISNAPTPGT